MIVYNVERRFYAMKADADTYRKQLALKPAALLKLEITSREDLAGLLTDLCAPPLSEQTKTLQRNTLIDRAFVAPDIDIPRFLQESWDRLLRNLN